MTAPNDDANERFRVIEARAGSVAHDLNNLMAAILAVVEEALADGERQAPLLEIQAYAERGAALVRRLLGERAGECAPPIALGECLAGMAPLLRRLAGSRIKLDLAHDRPGPVVRIEPSELERVLTNLVVNARDAMPDGGEVVIRIGEIEQPPFPDGETAMRPGRYATIEVTDNGAGIVPDLLGRIGAPFVTTKPAGTGLGLVAAHGIVRRAGGCLLIDSAPGQGTRVRLHLPIERRAARVPTTPRAVLLVEDEDAVRRMAERGLSRRGWRVISAASAEEALAGAGDTRPALLISDLALPGEDGLALHAALRRDQPGLPAILTSGYADEALRRACAKAGAVLLVKPYALRRLLDTADDLAPGLGDSAEVVPGA